MGLMVIKWKPWKNETQKYVIDLSQIVLSYHFIWIHLSSWLSHLREAKSKDSTFLRTENSWAQGPGSGVGNREWTVGQDRFLEICFKSGFTIFLRVSLGKVLDHRVSAFKRQNGDSPRTSEHSRIIKAKMEWTLTMCQELCTWIKSCIALSEMF